MPCIPRAIARQHARISDVWTLRASKEQNCWKAFSYHDDPQQAKLSKMSAIESKAATLSRLAAFVGRGSARYMAGLSGICLLVFVFGVFCSLR